MDGGSTTSPPARKAAKAEPPTENPDSQFCNYYISRKHRFCRTARRPGSCYCPTHTTDVGGSLNEGPPSALGNSHSSEGSGSAAGGGARVPCPINPNHTVYAARLAKHVRVCPDLRFVTTDLPYYSADLHANRGVPSLCCAPVTSSRRFTHRDLSPEALAELQAKIVQCYNQCVAKAIANLADVALVGDTAALAAGTPALLAPSGSDSDAEEEEKDAVASAGGDRSESDAVDGTRLKSRKHSPQHSALLQVLQYVVEQCSTFSPSGGAHIDGFLELGAGKGGLSVALQEVLVRHAEQRHGPGDATREPAYPFLNVVAKDPHIVVVDLDGFRRKGDAKVNKSTIPLSRIRINIKDLDLCKALEGLPAPPAGKKEDGQLQRWIALGKHLCGACTDFALSCALTANAEKTRVHVPAMVIATCCHHRCELRHMNPPTDNGQGTAFPQRTPPASEGSITLPGTPSFTFTEQEFAAMTSMSSWAVCGDFVDASRREVGYQCKRIIDELRVACLRSHGFSAVQCRYTTTDVTGENSCILAWQLSPRAAEPSTQQRESGEA